MAFFKKVFLSLVLVGTLLMMIASGFSGCSSGRRTSPLKTWMEPSEQMRVLTTTAQIGDVVSQIGGDRVKVWVLIQGDLDPHSYELVKGDDEKFSSANLVFYHGLHLEHGASLASLLQKSPHAVAVADDVALRHPEKILKRGDIVDPHLWMDISLWKEIIAPVVDSLSSLDPAFASYYKERGDQLALAMDQEHLALKNRLHQVPQEKRYLLTSHDAFRYFTRSYLAEETEEHWKERFDAPEGLSPDGQLSPVDIQRMIDYLRAHQISVLFPESNVSRDAIRKIAEAGRQMGLEVRVCNEPLYGDSMSGLSYFAMMRENGDVIARHLQ